MPWPNIPESMTPKCRLSRRETHKRMAMRICSSIRSPLFFRLKRAN